MLSALDGAPPKKRQLAGDAVDLVSGGQAAQILVVSKLDMNDPELTTLNDRLRKSAARLAEETDSNIAVTGTPARLVDYDRTARSRMPLLVAVTVLVTLLMLILVVRALPLAAIAVVLNLLTAGAAFGVLRVLFEVPDGWPFSGTGDFDAVAGASIFGVVFGLSIDYAVFLLMRMRESWERDGDNDAAIAYGLQRTAGVITGAATIMATIFMVFGTSSVPFVAQFGVALTVAILLDATVVRLILLPVLMTLIGPRVWWLPGWLDRRLPRLNIHGT
jgi:RND superfamily putative drug exporter